MKTLFIEARYSGKVELDNKYIEKLPKNIGLVATIQFIDSLENVKNKLEKNYKKVFIGQGKQKHKGQILGCDYSSATYIKDKVDAFLYIGTGEFHPIGLALATKNGVFIFNPISDDFKKLDDKEIKKYEKKKEINKKLFLNYNNVGILVSLKLGQQKLQKAINLKEKYKDKNCYIFVFDTLRIEELENFPFIDCWVNTACPRISDDEANKPIIDISEIK